MSPLPFVVFRGVLTGSRIAVIPSRVVVITAYKQKRYKGGTGPYAEREFTVDCCTIVVDGESAGQDGAGFNIEGTLEEVITALKEAM